MVGAFSLNSSVTRGDNFFGASGKPMNSFDQNSLRITRKQSSNEPPAARIKEILTNNSQRQQQSQTSGMQDYNSRVIPGHQQVPTTTQQASFKQHRKLNKKNQKTQSDFITGGGSKQPNQQQSSGRHTVFKAYSPCGTASSKSRGVQPSQQ